MNLVRKEGTTVPELLEKGGIPYLSFPLLEETGIIQQAFTTRLGGVSKGACSSLNLSFTRGDDPEDVKKNYELLEEAWGLPMKDSVLSHQTHTVNIKKVTKEDKGKGLHREKGYVDIDGLMTNEPGIPLVTFFADCVPLYFVDPVKKAIAVSHSGWRGTVNQMGPVTIEAMSREYGTRPEDLYCAIGPSICQDCYEIGPEVAEEFERAFPRYTNLLLRKKENGKYQLNLWKANEILLLEAGVLPERIQVTGLCTHCNSDVLFSHRTTGNARGNLSAILCLK